MNWRSISSVAIKSAITPSRSGRIVSIASGVRPTIFLAVIPTAMTSRIPLRFEMATTDGSLIITPRPATWTSVFAVPRSIEISSEKALPTPLSTATVQPSIIVVRHTLKPTWLTLHQTLIFSHELSSTPITSRRCQLIDNILKTMPICLPLSHLVNTHFIRQISNS